MKKGGQPAAKKLKNIPKFLWDEFVYGSHLVAIGDISALFAMSLILNIKVSLSFFAVIYLSILAINFFNRYTDAEVDKLTNSDRYKNVNRYFGSMPAIMAILFGISFLITVVFAPITAVLFMLALFGIGVLYSVALKKVTRRLAGFKNVMTALPYAMLVIFMVIFHQYPITSAVLMVTMFYFIRMLINTVFFDIKDIDSDKKEGLMTLPVVFGEVRTKYILMLVNIISALLVLAGVYLKILPLFSISIILCCAYSFLYLNNHNLFKKQTTLYNIVVDGEFIMWLPYLLIGTYLK